MLVISLFTGPQYRPCILLVSSSSTATKNYRKKLITFRGHMSKLTILEQLISRIDILHRQDCNPRLISTWFHLFGPESIHESGPPPELLWNDWFEDLLRVTVWRMSFDLSWKHLARWQEIGLKGHLEYWYMTEINSQIINEKYPTQLYGIIRYMLPSLPHDFD